MMDERLNPQEVHKFFRGDENSSLKDPAVSSSSVHIQPPATIDVALASSSSSPESAHVPGPDSDEDEEMPDPRIPA